MPRLGLHPTDWEIERFPSSTPLNRFRPDSRAQKNRFRIRLLRVRRRFFDFRRGAPERLKRAGSELLSRALERSTIAAETLNGRVRDGNGCYLLAMAASPEWNDIWKRENRGGTLTGTGRGVSKAVLTCCYCQILFRTFRLSRGGPWGKGDQAERIISTG